jgi:hypothetical protein
MNAVTESKHSQDKRRWRQFFSLLLIFFLAGFASLLLPTPGSWSDVRSQWVPSVAMALTTSCLFIATFWVYRRIGFIFKIQAVILWLLFGVALIGLVCALINSFIFLRELR